MVGGPCLDCCRGNKRSHLPWHTSRRIQDTSPVLRPTRHWNGHSPRGDRLHLHRPLLQIRRREHLRVPHRTLRPEDQEHGQRHLPLYPCAGDRGAPLSRRSDPRGDLAAFFPGNSSDAGDLFLGYPVRDLGHHGLHGRGRDQGGGLDRPDSGEPDARIGRVRALVPRRPSGRTRVGWFGAGWLGSIAVDPGGMGFLPPLRQGALGHALGALHDFCGSDRLDLPHHGHPRHGSGHGSADADGPRPAPLASFADPEWTGRYPDRLSIPLHWYPALALLQGIGRTSGHPRQPRLCPFYRQ